MKSSKLYIYNIIRNILPETRFFSFKNKILRKAGVIIGDNVRICSSVKIIGDGQLSIGGGTWIGLNTFILSASNAKISIENNVDIGPHVYMGTGTHEMDLVDRMAGTGKNLNITIGRGTWVGARSVILPGVSVGEMCVVAAGSVVTKDVASYSMVGGVPAKLIKNIQK